MKNQYFVLLSVVLVSLFSACQKEPDNSIDNGTYSYSLSVLNDDYTEVIPIKGVKASQVASKSNLPSWVRDVYLTGEVENGMQLNIRGEGHAAPGGGQNGDLLVVINEIPHPQLQRDGNNLFYTCTISVLDAMLGREVSVPCLDLTREDKATFDKVKNIF